MKILKPGIAKSKQPLIGNCGSCGCQVEVSREECKMVDDRDGEKGSVPCPTEGCTHSIWCYPTVSKQLIQGYYESRPI